MSKHLFKKGQVVKSTSDEPPMVHPIDRFYRKNTRKSAIDAFCANCMGEEMNPDKDKRAHNPGYKKDIRACTSLKCPLYSWRPYQ